LLLSHTGGMLSVQTSVLLTQRLWWCLSAVLLLGEPYAYNA